VTRPEVFAERARRAHNALWRHFGRRDSLFRRSAGWRLPGVAEHLWPTARALVGSLDLSGAAAASAEDREAAGDCARRQVAALERYWDDSGPRPAYASDVWRVSWATDRYYDDNAWVALGLVQMERLDPGCGAVRRAGELWRFAQAGWDRSGREPAPGGVFWLEQGRGRGRRNHDRNTVSTAPNAELGLHLRELAPTAEETLAPERMYAWVRSSLRHRAGAAAGLYQDRFRGDGTVDPAPWSYNQGSMIGAGVLLHRLDGAPEWLREAEDTARRALDHWRGRYFSQPPAFNAILFRNLLLLHAQTPDESLRARILETLRTYAEDAWEEHRNGDDLLRDRHGRASVLNQSGLVQVTALCAWDPADYVRLA
jgi:hypothetical protein